VLISSERFQAERLAEDVQTFFGWILKWDALLCKEGWFEL